VGQAAKAAGLTAEDGRGLLYDRDVVAFYGDPAWEARMADRPKFFEQTLTENKGAFTFEIKPNRGADSFQPVNSNGSQRGGRPFIAFFPKRLGGVKIIAGAELNPVITDNFILVPNPGACDPSKKYRVVFNASPLH
jgi:zinc protease